jgi:hypothetical protein
VIRAYLGYNITAIQKQLMGIASLIKKMSGNNIQVIDLYVFCTNKAMLCSGTNDAHHISEELFKSSC